MKEYKGGTLDVPSAGLMDMDLTQSFSEPVRRTCFAFQNATICLKANSAAEEKKFGGLRTLFLDEYLRRQVLVPDLTLVYLRWCGLEEPLRFLKVAE